MVFGRPPEPPGAIVGEPGESYAVGAGRRPYGGKKISYNEQVGTLPGFVEGFNKVARDEHRHVAFGARFLRDMANKDDKYREAIVRTLAESGPAADGVLMPPWYEEGVELFGVSLEETREFAMKALERRLKVIGLAPVA